MTPDADRVQDRNGRWSFWVMFWSTALLLLIATGAWALGEVTVFLHHWLAANGM